MSGEREIWVERARNVLGVKSQDFRQLIFLAGLDPKSDLRFQDWTGCNFTGCDLRGFDFTASRLRNCNFKGALIEAARFDQAEINGSSLRTAADWERYAESWRIAEEIPSDDHLPVGAVFQDAPFAPEMVVIPPGSFKMGSPVDEKDRSDNEGPQHEVTIPYRFAVGRFAVTFEEWDAAVEAGGVSYKPNDGGWGRGRRPVIYVSWENAQTYVKWLSEKTGSQYRLLSETEWEYVCRADTTAPFWRGSECTPDRANYSGNLTLSDNKYGATDRYGHAGPGGGGGTKTPKGKPLSVDEFAPNHWGLYQVHGNVSEWCEDLWHESYEGKPINGAAWISGGDIQRVLRGGSWRYFSWSLRAARRSNHFQGVQLDDLGFRVARMLSP